MMQGSRAGIAALFASVALCGCRQPAPAQVAKEPPAKVANGGLKEADLGVITLTEEAERRLGIGTALAEEAEGSRTGTWAGEIALPPGQSVTVAAPLAGTVTIPAATNAGARVRRGQVLMQLAALAPVVRDLRVAAEAEVEAARTRVEAAKLRAARAEQLLRDEVGSVRAVESVKEEAALAETALAAAREKLALAARAPLDAGVTLAVAAPRDGLLRQIQVATGQAVAGGQTLFEVAQLDPVWIRVPVYAGELAGIPPGPALVRPLKGGPRGGARRANPVAAPPTADPLASTVDLYFELANPDHSLRPGERLSVTLPLKGAGRGLRVPRAAILYDIHGGTLVYQAEGEHRFRRRKVEVADIGDGAVLIARGLEPGAIVVTAGAAELFGTEFGPGR